MDKRVELVGLSLEEMVAFVGELGQPRYRAVQIMEWIYKKLKNTFGEMTNLPKDLRQELEARARIMNLSVVEEKEDPSGAVKMLLRLEDGDCVEAVMLKQSYGTSVCVSSQLGCRMGCAMCASTIGGLKRNLTAGEMCGQVLVAERRAREIGRRVSHIVVMGIGEPLDNYEWVVKFLRVMNEPEGMNISFRRMTVSTCGHVPNILRLAREGIPVTLSVSLHAANDQLRDRLVPINRKYPLAHLIDACTAYFQETGRRVTFEYTLIKDVNDSADDAFALARLLKGMPCHVNLIPLNPVPERPYQRPKPEQVMGFAQQLTRLGVNVTIRKEMGLGSQAACGQLRRSRTS
ncbi:MAG: 23S rRNA (adenine(2503)-C(2))-methyltransferase RlmN [Bacillota bacterium]